MEERSLPRGARSLLIVGGAYVAAQMMADIASLRIITIAGYAVDAGTLIYPFTFTLRDLVHKIAGKEAAAGFRFLSPPVPKDLDTADAKAYLASYKKKYGEEPGSIYGVLAGDGFRVLAKAVEATKSTDPDKIREYFTTGLKDFPGFTGKIAFNAKGDRVGELYRVYAVDQAGGFVLQK